ncbi:EAL domain-containing protein [Nocardia sp. CA2R105]|uniref:EAL domain-containing protein n=1 Tax=Nocardia coffeae TaxID=2873381 RepID=UPI001CA69303|nr:EAL domain-containing protein [Nocardia coffeae]MBY8862370.1 EAL domain-containing protein [Nocardia coffeae]
MRLPDRDTSRAILIGIDRYKYLPDLPGVHAGAVELRDVLTDAVRGSLDPEHCTVLPATASPAAIGAAVAAAADRARDLLLIYFAGHGVLGPRRGELHLAAADTHPNRPGIGGIPFDAFRDLYVDSPARARVVILDCCYSGRALGLDQSASDRSVLNEVVTEGTAVLTSAPPNGISKKLDAETYPAYTGRLIRLLRDGVEGDFELLTLPVLHRQLCRELTAVGLRQPQADLNPLLDHLGLIRNRSQSTEPSTEQQLHTGIRSGQLELHYLPELDLHTGALVTIEALVRWAHPERGLLFPASFIRTAEKAGLATELGRWVLHAACTQFAQWHTEGLARDLLLRINVAPSLLARPDFVTSVEDTVLRIDVDPTTISIELAADEDTDLEKTTEIVRGLKRLGIKVGIGGFGTYNGSIAMLRRLPVDYIEIHHSFVQHLLPNNEDAAVVRAILGLASAFGLEVSAAGIETPEAARTLIELGCTRGQGYLFTEPMTRTAARSLIEGRGFVDTFSQIIQPAEPS